MAQINKYKIDWLNDDSSLISTKKEGPSWPEIWKRGREEYTIQGEVKDAFTWGQSIDEMTDFIDEEDWNETNFFWREGIEWTPGMTRSDARLLAETWDDDFDWAVKQRRVSDGEATTNEILTMGVGMIFDETNLIPFGIGFNGFKALARVPKLYKGIMSGAATTAAYSTAEQFLIYPQAEMRRRQREVQLSEQLQNIGFATLIGGGFGYGGAKLSSWLENRAIKKQDLQYKQNQHLLDSKNAIEKKLNDETSELDITTIEHDKIDSAPDDLENISLGIDTIGIKDTIRYNKDGQVIHTKLDGATSEVITYKNAEAWWNATKDVNAKLWKELDKAQKQRITKSFNSLKKIDEKKGRLNEAKKVKEKLMVEIGRGEDGILELKIFQKHKTQTILQMIVDNLREDKIRLIFNSASKRQTQTFEITRTQILDNLSETLRQMGLSKMDPRNPTKPTVRLYKSKDGEQILVYENRYDGSKNIILQNEKGGFKGGEVLSKAESTLAIRFIEEGNWVGLKKFLKARKVNNKVEVEKINAEQIDTAPEFKLIDENISATKKVHDQKINKITEGGIDELDNLAQTSGVKNADIDAVRKGQTTRQPTTDEKRANPDSTDTDLTDLKQVNDELNETKGALQELKKRMPKFITCKLKNIAKWIT